MKEARQKSIKFEEYVVRTLVIAFLNFSLRNIHASILQVMLKTDSECQVNSVSKSFNAQLSISHLKGSLLHEWAQEELHVYFTDDKNISIR